MPDATTLIHIDQYNTNKQNFEKKMQKFNKVKNKIFDTSSLVTTTVPNTKISE